MSPEQFTQIKNRIQSSSILSDSEKKEWMFLLPRMNAEEIKELDRILSLKLPMPPAASHPARLASESVAGRHFWSDLWKRHSENKQASRPVPPAPSLPVANPPARLQPLRRPDVIPKQVPLQETTKLSALSFEDIGKYPSIYVFLDELTESIKAMLEKNIIIDDIIDAYEKSPLHKLYLESGIKLINREKNTTLSREQFEALTDFRSNLRSL
ncbi:MAG: hypothetical protein A3A83_00465 [Candidatus Doudnabacteria bacterium RIFCSPLOWO2_01_FULL_48_57]|uniref:Uncharacterized protein n=1 Tax=Candidatus Doudnabacteria bacterium RIFCSPLOWO2_02_FULL_48_13 TaxID=1817845 RepID=A0A1F5QCJ0_9BACT|nr:MAG: hypothetical protein A3F44_00455 [Candidatus Doudnabacteria bacterium RIFCSPHIGHO2_12_FULL_47_25]OGE97868.1 MAG: hypothetical protein A3A83_00465 [Candidatus Doudnabacteria bacterium RIFCSPLOWO2_01_FULL_48_57]OGE99899.1 MAG: hypothetical protein A3J05_02600 [Candidatus Doudnabacteria bacterium RIFCSPLOWO2_02_FULL_48_13]